MSVAVPTGKRSREDDVDPVRVSRPKLALPAQFPDPHTFMEKLRHPWETPFERYSTEIRLKPNWMEKINDETIVNKWKHELCDKKKHGFMWNRLIAELQFLASLSEPVAEPSPVDRVWLKDGIVPEELHSKFVNQVEKSLESVPKEYHPYSKNTVVDLVHPALYCYVHGNSRVCAESFPSQLVDESQWKQFLASGQPASDESLKESLVVIEEAKKLAPEREEADDYDDSDEESDEEYEEGLSYDPELLFHRHVPDDPYLSDQDTSKNEPKRILTNHLASHYRWLPADVAVSMEGKVQFDSYINGLHPFVHKELYQTIAQIMEYFLPLWGRVLRDITTDPPLHACNRIDYTSRPNREDEEMYGLNDEDLVEEYEKKQAENPDKEIELLKKFEAPSLPPPIDLTHSSLKVIVKIASIELTPENPKYEGTWHVEGVPEERIISTGIYYFEEENIKDNFLRFRVAHGDPEHPDAQYPMGLSAGNSMNRSAGRVQTKQGRLLAFPNIMQHCVNNVSLQDETKPGHRKLLVFFLVDPLRNAEVVSSGTVPPPCKAWYDNLSDVEVKPSNSLQTLEEARVHRENLMFTRKFYVVSQNETLFERECTFCEH